MTSSDWGRTSRAGTVPLVFLSLSSGVCRSPDSLLSHRCSDVSPCAFFFLYSLVFIFHFLLCLVAQTNIILTQEVGKGPVRQAANLDLSHPRTHMKEEVVLTGCLGSSHACQCTHVRVNVHILKETHRPSYLKANLADFGGRGF